MSLIWTPPAQISTQRYTEKEMLDVARQLDCGSVKPRTIRTFEDLGLLDRRRRTWRGRGGGSSEGTWSRQQFDLWGVLLRQQNQLVARYGHRTGIHAALCVVVVGAWLYFGEVSGVPLIQVRRAMRSWASAHVQPGFTEAQRHAKQLVRTAAHSSATNRLELRKNLAEMIYTGHLLEREDLLFQLGTLIDPLGRGERKGPADAPISAENLTDLLLGRAETLKRLRSTEATTLPDGLWEWARFTLLLTRGWYQAAQPHLADDPAVRKHQELAPLYAPDTFESIVNDACSDLLSVLSVADLAKQATHLPPEQQPAQWLAGQFQLKVSSREQLSTLLLPGGNRQSYLELSMQLIRSGDVH